MAAGAAGPRAAAADFQWRAQEACPIRDRGCARVPATRGQGTTSRIDRSRSLRLRLSARPLLPRPGNRTQSHSLHSPLLKRRSAGHARERAEGRARARCSEPGESVAKGRRQTTVRKDVLITPDGEVSRRPVFLDCVLRAVELSSLRRLHVYAAINVILSVGCGLVCACLHAEENVQMIRSARIRPHVAKALRPGLPVSVRCAFSLLHHLHSQGRQHRAGCRVDPRCGRDSVALA